MPSSLVAGLLVPPKSVVPFGGRFALGRSVVLASPSQTDALPLSQLAAELKKLGSTVRVVRAAVGEAAVRMHRNQSLPPEHYHMLVDRGGVSIFAGDDAGAYYAVQTLRELLRVHGKSLPCCRIQDGPDFARRGVYHDCSRGKVPTLATLMELVERLAAWKINELQLYVENVFSFKSYPLIGRGYSPLTAAELLALGDHCKRHHVRLVGSLASFGHLERVLELPAYRHLGEIPYVPGKPPCMTLCPGDPGSLKLVRDMYEEFVPLFEPRDFNICCDETWEIGLGRSKARVKKFGVGTVYLEFLLKLHALMQGYGKRTNAWADIVLKHPELLDRLPKNMVMLNWDYNANPPGKGGMGRTSEIARAGLPLMVCPGTSAWQTHGTRLANAIGNVRQAAEEGLKNKAEGLLNTDWGDGGHRNFLGVSLHGFAHGAACSWNSRAVDDNTFTRTFTRQVFAQKDGKLADAIRKLGSSYNTVSDEYYNSSRLYGALVEPLRAKQEKSPIDQCKPKGLRQVIDWLDRESIWPPAPAGLPNFEAMAMEEYRTAAWMETLSARRVLAAQAIRAGHTPPPRQLATLAAEMREMTKEFSRLWMRRNKPSRLRDNVKALTKAAEELI